VIRTRELLAAREIDGAEQFFTRALDFGYSKSPEETMRIWGHDEILADMVLVIRRFRPDVIITRFPTTGEGGHGHHTASAMLAVEAFEAAADPKRFPEQLAGVEPWRARRLVWNRFSGRDTAASRPGVVEIDLGVYNPLLGRSYTEIAAASRSMHKSQGFGAAERRGPILNRFELLAGEPTRTDLFEGVTTGWSRVPGASKIDALLARAERDFRPDRPHLAVPALLEARAALRALPADLWVRHKLRELDEVVRSCAGLWLEAVAVRPSASPGAEIAVQLGAINRSPVPMTLERIELPHGASALAASGVSAVTGSGTAVLASTPADTGRREEIRDRALESNRPVSAQARIRLPADAPTSEPFWLRQPARSGRFEVEPERIGDAANPPALAARFVLRAGAERITYDVPVAYRWTDPVAGERWRAFDVVPPVTARFEQGVYVFSSPEARDLRVVLRSGEEPVQAVARLELPAGWSAEPASHQVTLKGRADEAAVSFRVRPGPATSTAAATATVVVATGGAEHRRRLVTLDHPHIPVQILLPRAEARLVRADIARAGQEVGYVMGSGDQVPEALRQMGWTVTLLSDEDLERADLGRFHAIVVGVRAYNTRPALRARQPRLLEYAERGGTVVVQYSTSDRELDDRLGPWPFKISRDRVTDETAEMKRSSHPLLSRPNAIGAADFEGWVQERGIYFANAWDPRYETPLAAHDPGEKDMAGGLLYARHGKGVFIYTGYAWFRQLPAGVPGAYRLFANLVSAKP
jgi:hypothetical protein